MVLTVKEVAASLKLTTKTVYKLISSGGLKAVHVGGQWRVRQTDLDAYVSPAKNGSKKH